MALRSYPLTNLMLDVAWRSRLLAHQLSKKNSFFQPRTGVDVEDTETPELRALIRRFPMWRRGRLHLANRALDMNEVALAYAEALALRQLSSQHSYLHTAALFLLGRCFLRRGDSRSAIHFLNEAHQQAPHDYAIQEERAAAFVLDGDKTQALTILQSISPSSLSPEGKAAIQWLTSQTR